MTEKKTSAQVSFRIGSCPQNVYESFDGRAEEHFGHCYWMYIKHLMEIEQNYELVNVHMEELRARVELLEAVTSQTDVQPEPNALTAMEEEEPRTGLGSKIPRDE